MVSIKTAIGILVIFVLLIFAFTYKNPVSSSEGTVEYTGLFFSERVTRYPMVAEVTDSENNTLGIAVEEHLNFGRIPSGSDVRKTLLLNNDDPNDVKIRMTSEGDISPYVFFNNNNFIFSESEEIEITFKSDDGGNFTGILSVAAIKPRNWLAGWFLQWT